MQHCTPTQTHTQTYNIYTTIHTSHAALHTYTDTHTQHIPHTYIQTYTAHIYHIHTYTQQYIHLMQHYAPTQTHTHKHIPHTYIYIQTYTAHIYHTHTFTIGIKSQYYNIHLAQSWQNKI